MTAPQPGRDGEVCATPECGHSASRHLASGRRYCYADRAFGKRCLCRGFRPSAPSEPPQCPDCCDGTCAGECGGRGAPGVLNVAQRHAEQRRSEPPAAWVVTAPCGGEGCGDTDCPFCPGRVAEGRAEPPAEAQQDDERVRALRTALTDVVRLALTTEGTDAIRDHIEDVLAVDGVLAARPSADTETLRPVLLALAERWESEVTPRSFHPAGTQADGRSQALADAAADLRAALDGER